jgi:hypothetical protein
VNRVELIQQRASLLDRARAAKGKAKRAYDVNDEAIDLAVAYVTGEVSDAQVAAAVGCKASNARFWTVAVVRRAVIAGKLKVERV